jgi:hypothetical protein
MSKFRVATQLVNDIRNLHGGRFLEPHATLTTKSHIVWCEAPLHRAVEKASQVRACVRVMIVYRKWDGNPSDTCTSATGFVPIHALRLYLDCYRLITLRH